MIWNQTVTKMGLVLLEFMVPCHPERFSFCWVIRFPVLVAKTPVKGAAWIITAVIRNATRLARRTGNSILYFPTSGTVVIQKLFLWFLCTQNTYWRWFALEI